MATQAIERASPVQVIRQNLTVMAPELKAALPRHVSVEKFTRVAMTAINNTPALQNADRKSLFGAIVRLAQDGLLPDGREAAIVMFGDKAQAMPMIAGILKKVRQSGELAKINAQVVHKNDKFIWHPALDEIDHEPPALDEERGEPIGAYALAVLKNGSQLLEVMSKSDIERVRKVSRASGKGPWVDWWGEMARKTVMRRLSKRLPMSSDLDDAFDDDPTMQHADVPTLEVVPPAEPMSRLDALEHRIEEAIDPQTGEVLTGRADTDHGDQHDGTESEVPAYQASVDDWTARALAAEHMAEINAIQKQYDLSRAALPDDVVADLDAAISAARKRIGGAT